MQLFRLYYGSRGAFIGMLLVFLMTARFADALPTGLRSTWCQKARVVALADLAAFYGMAYKEGPGSDITLQSKWSLLKFEAGGRKVVYNGTLIWLHKPLMKSSRGWGMDQLDVDKVVVPLLSGGRTVSKFPVKVIMLDPGHGGRDHGATGPTGVEEKRVVADVAKRTRAHLEAAGFKVVMSREGDEDLTLEQRTSRAAAHKVDVLISIHLNAATSRVASGSETYVLASPGGHSTASYSAARAAPVKAYPGNRFDEASMALGFFLQRELVASAKSADRGVRQGRLYVLKEAPCPASLVELEFVSNRVQEGRMKAASWRETMAQGLARGIIEYARAANGS